MEPGRVEVVRVEVVLPDLSPVFDRYRIVQVSDLHIDRWMDSERLGRIVGMVNDLSPDMVVMTGDILTDPQVARSGDFSRELSRIRASDAKLAVLGNYDYDAEPDDPEASLARELLGDGGFMELANESLTVRRAGESLHIGGTDDFWHGLGRPEEVLRSIPVGEPLVMLVHEPDFADEIARSGRVGLQLSGHTHGGQVRLPVYGGVNRPRHGRRYTSGTYRVGGMVLHVNRGVGMFTPRFRFRCRPEISEVTLRSPQLYSENISGSSR